MGQLRSRFDDHLSRKIYHIGSGTLIAYLFAYSIPRPQAILLFGIGATFFISLELLRLSIPRLNQFVIKKMGFLMREEERKNISANLFYVLGLAWALVFLPKVIAVQAILTLAWMDPIAGIFGVRVGRTPWNQIFRRFFVDLKRLQVDLGAKTVEGSFAGFLAACLAGFIAWTGPWAAYPLEGRLWWPEVWQIVFFSVGGGLAAMVSEGWPSQWDDNTNIPFWTGLVVWALALMVGVPLVF